MRAFARARAWTAASTASGRNRSRLGPARKLPAPGEPIRRERGPRLLLVRGPAPHPEEQPPMVRAEVRARIPAARRLALPGRMDPAARSPLPDLQGGPLQGDLLHDQTGIPQIRANPQGPGLLGGMVTLAPGALGGRPHHSGRGRGIGSAGEPAAPMPALPRDRDGRMAPRSIDSPDPRPPGPWARLIVNRPTGSPHALRRVDRGGFATPPGWDRAAGPPWL